MRVWSISSSHVEIYGVPEKSFATHSISHKLSGFVEYLVHTPSTMPTTMLTTMLTTMPSMVRTDHRAKESTISGAMCEKRDQLHTFQFSDHYR